MLLFLAVTCVYLFLIGLFIIGFLNVQEIGLKHVPPITSFSILIPFRNESTNLPELLESIKKLQYPDHFYEVLLINDESEDNYLPIIQRFIKENPNIKMQLIDTVRQSLSPKKDALQKGIEESNHDWILTTDADCVLPPFWMTSFDTFIQKHTANFIAGPITFKTNNSFLDTFQVIDLSALIGCTIGAFGIKQPFLCNGANLCYKKSAYKAVGGYEGNNHIASGDDIFLLEKFNVKYANQVYFLKSFDGLIKTSTAPNLKALINQRIRWASKTTYYKQPLPILIGFVVFFMNIAFALIILQSLIFQTLSFVSIFIVCSKIALDFIVIFMTLHFKKNKKALLYYPLIALIHPFFNLLIILLSLFKKNYLWKNRIH